VLHRGYVYKSKLGLEKHFGEWHDILTTEVLFASYSEFAKAKNERHPMAREAFGAFMIRMGGKYTQPRNAIVGEHITDVVTNAHGDIARTATLIEKARATGYSLGSLAVARSAFQTATKLTVEWERDDEEAESQPQPQTDDPPYEATKFDDLKLPDVEDQLRNEAIRRFKGKRDLADLWMNSTNTTLGMRPSEACSTQFAACLKVLKATKVG
jgi:hypothetical protein